MANIYTITHETGDVSQYTDTAVEDGNTYLASTDAKYLGAYGAKALFGDSNNQCMGYNTFSAQTEFYARFYVYISPAINIEVDGVIGLFVAQDTGAWGTKVYFRVLDSNSDGVADAWIWGGDTLTIGASATNFSMNVWHCVEVHWKKDEVAGGIEIWVDNTKIADEMDVDTSGLADCDIITHGCWNTGATIPPSEGDYFYFDDIEVDDSTRVGVIETDFVFTPRGEADGGLTFSGVSAFEEDNYYVNTPIDGIINFSGTAAFEEDNYYVNTPIDGVVILSGVASYTNELSDNTYTPVDGILTFSGTATIVGRENTGTGTLTLSGSVPALTTFYTPAIIKPDVEVRRKRTFNYLDFYTGSKF